MSMTRESWKRCNIELNFNILKGARGRNLIVITTNTDEISPVGLE
jgi:hypothetical protein